jgi:hypothetical protein
MGKDFIHSIDKLKGAENYDIWKFQMTQVLESKDLDDCIRLKKDSNPECAVEEDATKIKKAKNQINLMLEPNVQYVLTKELSKEATKAHRCSMLGHQNPSI